MNPRLVARQCARSVPLLRAKEEISMARKVGQIIARGDRRWLIRVYLGRNQETNKRKYHNRTIHGPMREAQAYLTRRLRERDLGRDLEGAKITLNEYLDRWLETAVKPRVREKTSQDYEGMLRRYVRPSLGERLLTATASSGSPNHLSADDGTWPVFADCPLRARRVEVRDAAGGELASYCWRVLSMASNYLSIPDMKCER